MLPTRPHPDGDPQRSGESNYLQGETLHLGEQCQENCKYSVSKCLGEEPQLDGFQSFFLQRCGFFLGNDLWQALEGTRNFGNILSKINHTFLTLIPKNIGASDFGDYHLIALYNTVYKILTKALANRLRTIIPCIILDEHIGFIPI